ncbi:DNA polymerase-3 subunit epsilon [Bacilli bacterium PM5-3]|nr:DNA polymerase-3 subunit epsilon [Bacilli bacterium PM5-3]MDH6603189.1 DNA polymerase-3 subunit epsilon [Bacilli bacterium PM5-9]
MAFLNQNYVIIDFETANSNPDSICQIGMLKVSNGKIIDTYNKLVKPQPLYFSSMNTSIHGIKSSDVKNALTFLELWNEILDFIDNNILIAHFAQFDMNCLCKTLKKDNQTFSLSFTCSCRLAKELIIAPNHKLTYLSENITNFEYQAHDALEDCYATYELISFLFKNYDIANLINSKFEYGKIDHINGYKGFVYKKNR